MATPHTPTTPAMPAAMPEPPMTAPALSPPRWSGKKTAVAAALAIGFSSVGAVAAAATVQQGTGGAADSRGGPGGGFGQQGQLPGQGAAPGRGQLPGQGQLGTGSQQPPGQGLPQQGTGTQ